MLLCYLYIHVFNHSNFIAIFQEVNMIVMEVTLFLTDIFVAAELMSSFEGVTTDTTMHKLSPTTCDFELLLEPHY